MYIYTKLNKENINHIHGLTKLPISAYFHEMPKSLGVRVDSSLEISCTADQQRPDNAPSEPKIGVVCYNSGMSAVSKNMAINLTNSFRKLHMI